MAEVERTDTRRRNIVIAVAVVIVIVLLLGLLRGCLPTNNTSNTSALAKHSRESGAMLNLGDAVTTGFSGTSPAGDQIFIDGHGAAARIFNPRNPGFVWDGRYWAAPRTHDIPASAVGQVFGVTIDDLEYPNIYLAATSLYGLNLVVPPPRFADDTRAQALPRRVRTGRTDAEWMAGQFGPGGGPGSIWKIDGRSGRIFHFADVAQNSGPASLGNIAYDTTHKQLFVSDLSSGMIRRIALDGHVLDQFDHGVTGRRAAHLVPIPQLRAPHADIHDARFDTGQPSSWGFAPPARRPFGLAAHGGRLYYAIADGQIWSVGLDKDGAFTADVRWEIDVPDRARAPAVSDIVFTHGGTMIVAQRSSTGTTFDYKALPANGVAHVYRFTREKPDNPVTPGAWYQLPEEYAVGFAGDNRGSAGGVALGYGYRDDGSIDLAGCEDALFLTGDALRDFHEIPGGFAPRGALRLYGLQVSPSGPVRGFNTPPAISYFVNYAERMGSADARGTVGSVKVYRVDCKDPGCKTPSDRGPLSVLPPTRDTRIAALPPGVVTPPAVSCVPGSPGCSAPCTAGSPGCGTPCVAGSPGCVNPCTSGTPGCGTPCIPGTPGCGTPCIPGTPGCDTPCVPGTPGCPISGETCMALDGKAVCDTHTGTWTFQITTTDPLGLGIDTVSAFSSTPGVSVSNGPDITVSPGVIALAGAAPGQSVHIDVCGFRNSDRNSGHPYDCCREVLKVKVPTEACTASPGGGQ